MKRRDFLKALLAVPALPYVPAPRATWVQQEIRVVPALLAAEHGMKVIGHPSMNMDAVIVLLESRIRHAERDMLDALTRRIYEDS